MIGATILGAVAFARAQEGPTPTPKPPIAQAEKIDPDTQRLVQVLLGEDWKTSEQAAQTLTRRGVAGARAVLSQRAKTRSARERDRLDRVLREVVNSLVVDIQRPIVSPPPRPAVQAALGDAAACVDPSGGAAISSEQAPEAEVESAGATGREEPKTGLETRLRARAATNGLLALGPAAIGLALEVPPVRPPAAAWTLGVLFRQLYEREAARAVGHDASLRESYMGRGDLAAWFLIVGISDPREPVRTAFQAVRDDAIELSLSGLDATDPDRRECSQDELYRLGDLAKGQLGRIARGENGRFKSAEARVSAERLCHRIQFRLSKALIRKLGSELEGYPEMPFDKRRSIAFALERLGGADAVPALRQLLVEEKTVEVQAVAAVGLFKQGDMAGAEWLQLHNQKVNLIAKRDLAALILDQGNNYLKFKKWAQAEQQYLQVLELEPKNEYALYNLACCYSLWGKTDKAFEYLKKAIDAGFDDTSHMDTDTDLDPIRDDPRFKQLMDGIRAKKGEGESGDR